jgi:diguanylate cyclase (GGDEF)-like protein/PAS domain S-box-containing protein
MNQDILNLLLITKIEDNYHQIKHLLEQGFSSPFHLEWVSNLIEAFRAKKHQKYDAYLLNSQGENFRYWCVKVNPTPVILITKETEIGIKALSEGISDYLLEEQLNPILLEHSLRLSIAHSQTKIQLQEVQKPNHQSEQLKNFYQNLQEVRNLYTTLAESVPVGIYQNDAQGSCIYINQKTSEIIDISFEECLGHGWVNRLHPDDAERILQSWTQAFNTKTFWQEEYRFLHRDGTIVWVMAQCIFTFNEQGESTGSIGALTDINERKQLEQNLKEYIKAQKIAEETLRISEMRYRTLVETLPGIIYCWSSQKGEFYVSQQVETILGYTAIQFQKHPCLWNHYIHSDDRERFSRAIQDCIQGKKFAIEYRIQDKQGKWHWFYDCCISSRRETEEIIIEGLAIDLTERKKAEILLEETKDKLEKVNQKLEKLVMLDGLTGIPNRRYFDEILLKEWRRLRREEKPLSLMMIDIDYFKNYNDTYGHLLGDKTLILVAQTLANLIQRSADLVARYGGEEFAVILPNTDTKGTQQIAEQITDEIRQLEILHESSQVSKYITLSIGISTMIPHQDQSPKRLINQADNALYCAKSKGRNRIIIM